MDKYNLLDDDDFFSQINSEKKEEPKEEQAPSKEEPISPELDEPAEPIEELGIVDEPDDLIINMDDDAEEDNLQLIDDSSSKVDTPEKDENIAEDISVEILEDEPDVFDDTEPPEETITDDEFEELDEPQQESQEEFVDDYYVKAQQEKINFKPILIGAGIIIGLAIIIFILFSVFKGDKEEVKLPVAEEVKQPSPVELKRLNFLSSIANKTSQNLKKFGNILSLHDKRVKITSVYLYGEEFIFEVYCPSRDDLGKFNMGIRNKFPDGSVSLVSSQVRPGTKGGIFGVYTVALSNASTNRDSTINFNSENSFKNWLSGKVSQSNLELISMKNMKSFSNSSFRVIQFEGTINGDYQSCYNLINSLTSERRNIEFYKLTSNPRNLKNFSAKKYQLSFIIRLYL